MEKYNYILHNFYPWNSIIALNHLSLYIRLAYYFDRLRFHVCYIYNMYLCIVWRGERILSRHRKFASENDNEQ